MTMEQQKRIDYQFQIDGGKLYRLGDKHSAKIRNENIRRVKLNQGWKCREKIIK